MAPAKKRSLLVVTPGDPDGVGPEIAWKAIRSQWKQYQRRGIDLLCVGAEKPFREIGARVIQARAQSLSLGPPRQSGPYVWLLPAPVKAPSKKQFLAGYQSGWSIEVATKMVLNGKASALVTGPISKERLQQGGYFYHGHTEFLADLCCAKNVTMMLANDQLRISLVTTHLALKDVSRSLSREKLRRAILHTVEHLKKWWGIRQPRIAVAALNPHAGEAGLFGNEEIRVISPEIRALQKKGFVLEGPFPADTLFAKHVSTAQKARYDAVVCMYHDQGLIPVKLLDFPHTVNITLGLPIVRTSVDHGVGFDIARTGKADPSSFQSAIELAIDITRHRGKK